MTLEQLAAIRERATEPILGKSIARALDQAILDRRALLDHVDTLAKQLAAKNRSIGVVNPGGYAKPSERPDDSEINEAIDDAETFAEALFDIADKYGANVTNNMERWQDGEYLRHVGEFITDIKQAADRFLVPARLAAVRELHYEDEIHTGSCTECSDYGTDLYPPGAFVSWPCRTIQAIDGD